MKEPKEQGIGCSTYNNLKMHSASTQEGMLEKDIFFPVK